VPEGELRVVGLGGVRRGVLAQGSGGVALGRELVADVGARVGAPEPQQAAELAERIEMVVHAQVDELFFSRPAAASGCHHEQRGRLAAAQVAALPLRRVERGQQPLGKLAARGLVAAHHRGRHRVALHDVGLRAHLVAERVAGVVDAVPAAVDCDAPGPVEHRDLAHVLLRIGGQQLVQGLGGALPGAHQLEPARPVGGIDDRLGRHGAHARLGPTHE
jgi:hypothetical protein